MAVNLLFFLFAAFPSVDFFLSYPGRKARDNKNVMDAYIWDHKQDTFQRLWMEGFHGRPVGRCGLLLPLGMQWM